jgi:hypothetical protein
MIVSGIFTPIVKVAQKVLGPKEFGKIKGKSIALHSQVITQFCKYIGANQKIRQGLIRVAKNNGEQLGLLD